LGQIAFILFAGRISAAGRGAEASALRRNLTSGAGRRIIVQLNETAGPTNKE